MKKIMMILAAAAMVSVAASCGGRNEQKDQTAEVAQTEQQETWTDSVISLCQKESSRNPIEVLERLMSQPWCHMHGPEHHVLVGAALLTAYNNCLPDTSRLDLRELLPEVISRGQQVPGGACGYMGACGASISTGIFMSVVTRNTPFSTDTWRLCNLCTSRALEQVALNGGPRCCKRDSYLSILAAVDFVKENLGVEMEKPEVRCSRSQINEQCIGKKCPFAPKE
ncbi:MAG: SAM-dependent methyltransferase [Bacteroidales bacterium]|nr:SAM-dependent methyltransferase [Bacteroidales bacterium]